MSRVHLASDTCDIYFTYTKVNHLLYTCSLDPFEDGILLDTSPVCMHRYCRNFTDDEEECKRQGTTTPSGREAWKRRRKKGEEDGATVEVRPDVRASVRIIRARPDHPGPPRILRVIPRPRQPNLAESPRRSQNIWTRSQIIRTPVWIIRPMPARMTRAEAHVPIPPPHLPFMA